MGVIANLFARVAPNSFLSDTVLPPDSQFKPERDIPDLAGKVVIVTGANTGVGFETAKQLVLKNAKLVGHGEALYLKLDLADLDSVKSAAEEFKGKEEKLDLLFCNAGVMVPPLDMVTAQGYDLQWGTNVVGHYLLCILLLPSLQAAFRATGVKPRIVTTSSTGHRMIFGSTGLLSWEALKAGEERDALVKKWGQTLGAPRYYGQSKFGNILVANLLQRRYGNEIVSMSCHPGGLTSGLTRHHPGWVDAIWSRCFWPVPMGALTQLWGATSKEGAELGGKYLIPWARVGEADARAYNEQTQDVLEACFKKELAAWLLSQ